MNIQENDTIYSVVLNHEKQYSIWPKWKKEIPLGWKCIGKEGSREECLGYIKDVWKDMRPLSLRQAMEKEKQAKS